MFIVYILSCSDTGFHVGITKDINARIEYYNSNKNESPLKNRMPFQIALKLEFSGIEAALDLKNKLSELSDEELIKYLNDPDVSQSHQRPKESKLNPSITKILPSSYLGNIAYFSSLENVTELIVDINDRYEKQTYRNRCTILSANGLLNLSVPVTRPNGKHTLVKDVLINYEEDWQKDHVKAIESAYRSAPFYEHFANELIGIINFKHHYLIDLNTALTEFLCQSLGLKISIKKGSENDTASIPSKIALLPKERENFECEAYQQVFLKPSEFEMNLSAIDLLFNCGKRF